MERRCKLLMVHTDPVSGGYVSFMIDSTLYKYRIDKGLLDKIERLAVHKPFGAVNLVKKCGKLIEKGEIR